MVPRVAITVALVAIGLVACASRPDLGGPEERSDDAVATPGEQPSATRDEGASRSSAIDGAREVPTDEANAPRAPSCPPDAPYVCLSANARGFACSAIACAPSCERIGCPTGFACLDCGGGAECVPARHTCE